MRTNKKRVTQKDIAQETGYATITVSKALRDAPDLAEETKRHIQRVADSMGYVINSSAISLKSGFSHTIALIVADITNPLFAIIAKAIEVVAQRMQYTVIVVNTEENEENERRAVRTAIEKNVDGVLLFQTQQSHDAADRLEAAGIPFVLLHRTFDDQAWDAVCIDEAGGGTLAGKRLLDRGCRRLVMLNAPYYISSARERQLGFEKAMAEAGGSVTYTVKYLDSALGGCRELLTPLFTSAEAPQGLFCFSDMLAFEAICVLHDLGLQVPKDVAVIGFDNIQAKLKIPFRLTTISMDIADLAESAVTLLLRRVQGDDADFPQRITLPVQLVDRASV